LSLILLTLGCGESTSPNAESETEGDASATTDLGESSPDVDATGADQAASGIALTAQNTKIQFVGVHADPAKPDPRTGHFETLTGAAVVEAGVLKSIQVDIETASLTTDIDKLTNHLKSADFFDVNQHPKATFASTSIEDAGDGKVTITGELTLLGTTQSVSFPATVAAEEGLTINAEFEIDRTQFGMTYGVENVKKAVAMTISVDA
jgi:polyisoprenoid-binding protein YceI